jgi:hypothetical protein
VGNWPVLATARLLKKKKWLTTNDWWLMTNDWWLTTNSG